MTMRRAEGLMEEGPTVRNAGGQPQERPVRSGGPRLCRFEGGDN
jgi:hypothetical protein